MSKNIAVSDQAVKAVSEFLDLEISTPEIIKRTGLSRTTVYRAYQVLGVRRERDRERTSQMIRAAWEEAPNADSIAGAVGMSRAHVYRVLGELGLEAPMPYAPPAYTLPDLNLTWAAEFRGFFYADGTAGLEYQKAFGNWRPHLIIRLRDDDKEILKDIHDVLGGYYRPYIPAQPRLHFHSNPQTLWAAYGWPRVRAIIEATSLNHGCLPARKQNDVALLYEAILARYNMPGYLRDTDRELLAQYFERIKEVKRYQL